MRALLVCTLLSASTAGLRAQSNARLSETELHQLAVRCAPRVAPDTIEAIVRQESALHPYALNVNYPRKSAKLLGYSDGNFELSKQPTNKQQAIHWTRWFIDHGYTVSIGLMQINMEQARGLGIHPSQLFEPCDNVRAGARLLENAFAGKTRDLHGLMEALSLYNSGSSTLGMSNGYASGVVGKAGQQ